MQGEFLHQKGADGNQQVEFRDPPISAQRPKTWTERLLPLREHQGRWAVVARFGKPKTAQVYASRLRNPADGRERGRPPGRWEFAWSKSDDGRGEVFARYLGPETDDEEVGG